MNESLGLHSRITDVDIMQECKSRLYPLFIDNKLNELVSLHASIAAQDLGPALAHLINLCSSPSKEYAEFVMNFGMCSLVPWTS